MDESDLKGGEKWQPKSRTLIELAILPAKIEQRGAFFDLGRNYFPNKDGMVAAWERVYNPALDTSERSFY
jgi:hypothetical protein